MAQKNDTTALVLALVVTLGLLGGGAWLIFSRMGGPKLGGGATSSFSLADFGNSGPAKNPEAFKEASSSFSDVPNVPTGLFNYGGSTSWAPARLAVDSLVQAARPEFRLSYSNPQGQAAGSSTGIQMLLSGELAFAQSSRPIKPEEYSTAQGVGTEIEEVAVAYDGIAVAVNPSLVVPGITPQQLVEIYTGQITSWRQVGGPDLAIQPFLRAEGGTTDSILQGQAPGSNVTLVNSTTEGLRALGNAPGGVYFASAPEIVPQCSVKALPMGKTAKKLVAPYQEPFVAESNCPAQRNKLNAEAFRDGSYPLTRSLYVVIQKNGGQEQQAGTAYAKLLLTEKGQAALANAGFVPLR